MYLIVLLPAAQTQGSTAMVTALPPNSGGYITSSFPTNDSAKQNIAKIFTQSSKARASLIEKHSQYPGYYATTQKPNKGFRITPILLPILGLDDTGGPEVDIFAATLSNVASEGRAVLIPHAQLCGSTIRLVSQDFAKTLPPKFPKGKAFKNTEIKVAPFKDLLPLDSDTKNYVLILCPNTLGIPAGETETVKGSSDDNMAEHFRELGKHAISWLTVQTEGCEGIVPFSAALQTLVAANKKALLTIYPKHTAVINLTPSQLFTFISPPAVEDEDDAIYTTIVELRARLLAATMRNTATAASQQNPLGLNVDVDMESVLELGLKPTATPASNTDRQEAKLRLMCASFCPTAGVTLLDLRDTIAEVLAEKKEFQPESFSNQLTATSNMLSQSMDAVNRSSNWPQAYADTP